MPEFDVIDRESDPIAANGIGWQIMRAELFCSDAVIIHNFEMMEAFLNEVIERVIHTFGMMRNLSEDALHEARQSLANYIETLSSAGETDPQRLAVFGLAYLRNRDDSLPPKFTGC
jgi:hypothetical protein